MSKPKAGGGFHNILYTFKKAHEAGGLLKMWSAMRSRNACKTCALGMGGQHGGMVNEAGHFPEFCKKSIQAMAADMQQPVPAQVFSAGFEYLEGLTPRQLEKLGRVTTPLVARPGATSYTPVSWEAAMPEIGAKLRASGPQRSFFYFSGRSSNEAAFLLQLAARVFGTNHVNNCSFYCHQASGVGLTAQIGQSTGTLGLEDLNTCDLLVLFGGNPPSNHPRFMRSLIELRRRGGKVVIINPLVETGLVRFKLPSDVRSLLFGSDIADLYLQPHIGGDIALCLAVAKRLVERGAHDRAYLDAYTTGGPELLAHLAGLDAATLRESSGVPEAGIAALTELLATSKSTVYSWAMGITHHLHGVDNVRAIVNLALLRGMLGRPGAGLMPLRGHSNIQGLGTIGVVPKLKQALFERLEQELGLSLPTTPGMDTMACMDAAAKGGIGAAVCLGGNLYGSNPDADYARKSFAAVDDLIYLTTTLNTGHMLGRGKTTWILPVLARDEEPEATTQESMFSYVRLSDGGKPRHVGPRGEVQIIAELAQLICPPGVDWPKFASAAAIRATIARVVPELAGLADIDRTKQEFSIPGRRLVEPKFHTADGKAKLAAVVPPRFAALASNQLRAMTIRSEGQFNSVVYEDDDRYRAGAGRDGLLMHSDDIARLGLRAGQQVRASNPTGSLLLRVVPFAVRAGNCALYYPEANVLVPRDLDPESHTPAFKHVVVTITAA